MLGGMEIFSSDFALGVLSGVACTSFLAVLILVWADRRLCGGENGTEDDQLDARQGFRGDAKLQTGPQSNRKAR